MRLGKASSYGILATIHIAGNDKEGPVTGKDLAKACGIPVEYLLKTLQQLVRGQVLRSERGRHGGFYLRRSPQQTTLLEIVEAVEGPLYAELSLGRKTKASTKAQRKVLSTCQDIAKYKKSKLGKITVKQLLG